MILVNGWRPGIVATSRSAAGNPPSHPGAPVREFVVPALKLSMANAPDDRRGHWHSRPVLAELRDRISGTRTATTTGDAMPSMLMRCWPTRGASSFFPSLGGCSGLLANVLAGV